MRPIVIFDNIIYTLQKAGGISAFWSNLTRRVEASGMFDCRYVEYPGATDNIFRRSLSIPRERIISGRHLPLSAERMVEPWMPPELLGRPFVFHSSYYRTFTHGNALNVSTFHDLTHEHGGDGNFITRRLMRRLHERALRHSRHAVCVSRNCLEDVRATFPKYADTPMSVAYNAPVCTPTSDETPAADGDYLLFVGARDDYKNFRFAVELSAVCRMPLRVAGAPFTTQERRYISGVKGAEAALHLFPSEGELCSLYAGARALVFMSEYEGFGIPIVEAQSLGCPVLALRRSAVPEIAGNGALIFDTLDLESVAESVRSLSEDTIRERAVRLGKENVKRFDWDKTAAHYMAIYRKLVSKR